MSLTVNRSFSRAIQYGKVESSSWSFQLKLSGLHCDTPTRRVAADRFVELLGHSFQRCFELFSINFVLLLSGSFNDLSDFLVSGSTVDRAFQNPAHNTRSSIGCFFAGSQISSD